MSTVHERLVALVLLLCALPATAWGQREQDDDVPKGWTELEVAPPLYPDPANLIEFEAGGASRNRFLIDPRSISVGSDGVVRYTLVVKGAGGGHNVSYEGIRCDVRQHKYYAFGRPDGTWSNARRSEWRRIEYKHVNRQHGVLYADYFCSERTMVTSPQEAIQRLKYGAPSRGSTGN
jgi:hypothetical protein